MQERNRKEVFRLVESIIELLSNHQQSAGEDNYLAISHVRDQLIPPYQRQRKYTDNAVYFCLLYYF